MQLTLEIIPTLKLEEWGKYQYKKYKFLHLEQYFIWLCPNIFPFSVEKNLIYCM